MSVRTQMRRRAGGIRRDTLLELAALGAPLPVAVALLALEAGLRHRGLSAQIDVEARSVRVLLEHCAYVDFRVVGGRLRGTVTTVFSLGFDVAFCATILQRKLLDARSPLAKFDVECTEFRADLGPTDGDLGEVAATFLVAIDDALRTTRAPIRA